MLVVTLVECLLKATKYFRVFYSTMIREYFYFRGDDTCCHGRGKDSVTCFQPMEQLRYMVMLDQSQLDSLIYRGGQFVFIYKSRNFTCPYRLLLRYLVYANINMSMYVFRTFVQESLVLKSSGKHVLGNVYSYQSVDITRIFLNFLIIYLGCREYNTQIPIVSLLT